MNYNLINGFCAVAVAVATVTGCSTKGANYAGRRALLTWTPERDPELRSLLKARYDAAVSAYKIEKSRRDAGMSTTDFTLRLAGLVADAEIDLAETPEQLIHALEKHWEVTKQFELEAQQRIKFGPLTPSSEESLTRCWRLAAEVDLQRAKRHFKK